MKLYFYGHSYKYAAEQMMLSLYPAERPEYPEGKPEGDRVELRLSRGKVYTTAVCRLVRGGKAFTAKSAVKTEQMTDDIMRDKLCSRIIKTAFYRAAIASGHESPAWGMLTGVRPGKLFREELRGVSDATAVRRFMRDYDVSEQRALLCRDTALVTENVAAGLGERDVCRQQYYYTVQRKKKEREYETRTRSENGVEFARVMPARLGRWGAGW